MMEPADGTRVLGDHTMGIKVVWDNEQNTIIRYVYEGRWGWDDLYTARAEVKTMLGSVPHKVGIIVDMRNSSLLPSGTISRARHLATSSPTSHSNEGPTIIVGANGLVRSIFDVMRKIYGETIENRKYYFASSLEEARTMFTDRLSLS
jgi:hypothetical protein